MSWMCLLHLDADGQLLGVAMSCKYSKRDAGKFLSPRPPFLLSHFSIQLVGQVSKLQGDQMNDDTDNVILFFFSGLSTFLCISVLINLMILL